MIARDARSLCDTLLCRARTNRRFINSSLFSRLDWRKNYK